MFEKTMAEIAGLHGRLDHEMTSSYYTSFTSFNKVQLDRCRESLSDARSRLARVHQTLADPLWVVLLGRFSAGKSSLINAFLQHYGSSGTRATGLEPTDKQVTVVLHQAKHTGLLPSTAGVAHVQGLSLIVQPHAVEPLRPLLLVDTPGLLDEQELDDSLMEFVGHADVVLHCMTPDAELILPDRKLLEKRRQYFPSQLYHIVITKADLHFAGPTGAYSEDAWQRNREQLALRYATFAKENLDLRESATTRKVWLVDSVSGRGIEQLLNELLRFGQDVIDDVPRVREPIARERFAYVCALTVRRAVVPLRECVAAYEHAVADSRELLSSELQRWENNTLTATRDIMRLELQALQFSGIAANLADQLASRLGIAAFLDPAGKRRVVETHIQFLIQQHLFKKIEEWEKSLMGTAAYCEVNQRHQLHKENYDTAQRNMARDALPEYTRWFVGSEYGAALRALLGFDTPEALIEATAPVMPSERRRDVADAPRQVALNCDNVEQQLHRLFTEGTDLVLSSAEANPPGLVIAALCDGVRHSLAQTRKRYEALRDDLRGDAQHPAADLVTGIMGAVQHAISPRVIRTVEEMRQTADATCDRVRAHLSEKGVALTVHKEPSLTWDEIRQSVLEDVSRVAVEKLDTPVRLELDNVVRRTHEEVGSLAASLRSREDGAQHEMLLDMAALKGTQRSLVESFPDWCKAFIAALKVFASVESRDNFFAARGIGDDLGQDLDAGLATVHTKLTNDKRFYLAQLVGGGLVVAALIMALIGIAARAIPVSEQYSNTVTGVILAFLGVAGTALGNAIWHLATFRRRGRNDAVRQIKSQLQKVCDHSEANLTTERRREEEAFGAVMINLQRLFNNLVRHGVFVLGQQMLEQVQERLGAVEMQCEFERMQAAKHIGCYLETFCDACRTALQKAAEDCAGRLYERADGFMSERMKGVDSRLEELGKECVQATGRLQSVEAELSRMSLGEPGGEAGM